MKSDVLEMDGYKPDYESKCENCDQSPCVTAVLDGKEVHHFGMCGPCTFGTAQALDPDWWNGDES